ncbi:MAG: purine-binding chemotaxis protein CheW [Acidimicrobiia bacterium]|jgi:purine-binding chemotaxis protein CheW|nr:purine-binding chemotaxis protein CheW [Acidimicrobiia bacterium]
MAPRTGMAPPIPSSPTAPETPAIPATAWHSNDVVDNSVSSRFTDFATLFDASKFSDFSTLSDASQHSDGESALVIAVNTEWYAIPAGSAREVVADPTVASLPTAPPAALGLFSLRGEIVPLFDTAQLLGLGRLSDVTHAAVLRTPAGPAGLAATALPRVVEMGARLGDSDLPGTLGTYAVAGRLAVLLDLATLLYPATVAAAPAGPATPAVAAGAHASSQGT